MNFVTPIFTGAQVIDRPIIYRLVDGTEVPCDPSDPASLKAAAQVLSRSALKRDASCILYRTTQRQLGDIALTTRALLENV